MFSLLVFHGAAAVGKKESDVQVDDRQDRHLTHLIIGSGEDHCPIFGWEGSQVRATKLTSQKTCLTVNLRAESIYPKCLFPPWSVTPLLGELIKGVFYVRERAIPKVSEYCHPCRLDDLHVSSPE